jgi:hypothetical protein
MPPDPPLPLPRPIRRAAGIRCDSEIVTPEIAWHATSNAAQATMKACCAGTFNA